MTDPMTEAADKQLRTIERTIRWAATRAIGRPPMPVEDVIAHAIADAKSALLAQAQRTAELEAGVGRLKGSDPNVGDLWWLTDDGEGGYGDADEAFEAATDWGAYSDAVVVQLSRARSLPGVWAARIILTRDEAGDPAETEVRCFGTAASPKPRLPQVLVGSPRPSGGCRGGAVIPRVVERADGSFKVQFRMFLFWWENSTHEASEDRDEQIAYAKRFEDPPNQKIIRRVYP